MDTVLCISLRPEALTRTDKEDAIELDIDETRDALLHALGLLGTVRLWDTMAMTPAEIASQERPDIIFNLAENFRGTAREAQLPALFEWLQWPYVGSDPVTQAIALDKWFTKCVLQAAGIATAPAALIRRAEEATQVDVRFPAILKPVAEGSGKGVHSSSVVTSGDELLAGVTGHLKRYKQPVLVEEFLTGREFTVAVIGNVGRWEVLPIVELDLTDAGSARYPVYSYDAKWNWTTNHLVCPAEIDSATRQAVETAAVATCDALGVRDWARVDIRLDNRGIPNVLEINTLPGVLPGISDISCFTLAAQAAGLDYNRMIHKIVFTALERYNAQV